MPTLIVNRQLAQLNPNSTNNTVLYTVPSSSTITRIKNLIVCNTTSSARTYSVYVNQGGTAVGDSFALIKTMSIAANASDMRVFPEDAAIILNGTASNGSASIIVVSSVASALTFTIYGTEISIT